MLVHIFVTFFVTCSKKTQLKAVSAKFFLFFLDTHSLEPFLQTISPNNLSKQSIHFVKLNILKAAEAVSQRCSVKKVLLEKFTEKHLCQSLLSYRTPLVAASGKACGASVEVKDGPLAKHMIHFAVITIPHCLPL